VAIGLGEGQRFDVGVAAVKHRGFLYAGHCLVGVSWSLWVWLNVLAISVDLILLGSSVYEIVSPANPSEINRI